METYLDTLVRKGSKLTELEEVNSAEEVTDSVTEVDDDDVEAVEIQEDEIEVVEDDEAEDLELATDSVESDVASEDVDDIADPELIDDESVATDEDPVIVDVTVDEEAELEAGEPVESTMEAASYKEGELRTVYGMIIYNTPDTKSLAKVFNGNIVIKGTFNDMVEVEYMKPGIGLVKGFIQKSALN